MASLKSVYCAVVLQFLVLQDLVSTQNELAVRWVFDNENLSRSKRDVNIGKEPFSRAKRKVTIDNPRCLDQLSHLCSPMSKDMDELFILECVQTFKPNEVPSIDSECQHSIWKYIGQITNNENIERLTRRVCGKKLNELDCSSTAPGSYLQCLIDKREEVKDVQCSEYIQRLKWVVFSDFRIMTPFVTDCSKDIEKFQCGRIQPYKEIMQGEMLACLQQHIDSLHQTCRKKILHVSAIQADNIKFDRQLQLACLEDHIRFCPNIGSGSQVYKCLMQHKMNKLMTDACQEQLERREKLIASDYRVSKGLARACKEDIRNNHCKKDVSDDKNIRLVQILLCLESAVKNGTKIAHDCQIEMFDHRKILMEDYKLSPEIVSGCANDIQQFCNSLEIGGITIHCLMEHARSRKKKSRISATCQRALEELIKETDAAEDWRVDPVLREACQGVVESACKDMRGGDARVMSCLMDRLKTDDNRMTEACETALIQIQYFVVRDYKLDPQLYKECKSDATRFCHAKSAWASDDSNMDPERGLLVLSCLYRYAYHPQKSMTLKKPCLEEIRRVMRQRAIEVDLQPEIEEVCLDDLATFCSDKTAKGEEILCLQDKMDSLGTQCKLAIGNLTEAQAEHVDLNPIIINACQHVMEKHCEDKLKYDRDENDVMECLIEHKNDLDSRTDYKCKAAIEHFQIISLQNYHFTFSFKEACRPHVQRWCPNAQTKNNVIRCLSNIIRQDIQGEVQHRIPKECRQQIKAQLYQRRENILLDPNLHAACMTEINKFCYKIEPGKARISECLAAHKFKLGEECHKQIFLVRKQEFQDNSNDYALLNTCRTMIKQYCHDVDASQALQCLKKWKDDNSFDDKCKDFVIKRMIEQNTDYRFNTALQTACSLDINKHCKSVLKAGHQDTELEGKVIACLKVKFSESKLLSKCTRQIFNILREAAMNYHLNPLLAKMCATEINTLCQTDDADQGTVEECLKNEFNADNKVMMEDCRLQVAKLIEEARADINVDPLLQRACAVDVVKFCSNVPQGAGRHIQCLQNVESKFLRVDCYQMLSKRIEMFKNAAKLTGPETVNELYETVNRSPAKRYFMILGFTTIGFIFIVGLFCGRVSRRTMIMKNK